MSAQRIRLIVQGQVQGVGFRPFVFTLAEEAGLTGFVRNSPRGVVIEVQGRASSLEAFAHSLRRRLPPLARITCLTREEAVPVPGERDFVIAQSSAGDSHAVLISPDISICADCRADMRAPENRRFLYPFTNCTNCGPRYTITRSIPYDRSATSMACFPMCPECRAEYENPRDRRFHAQPNACPRCGPRVWFVRNPGDASALSREATDGGSEKPLADDQAMQAVASLLAEGGITAIKGLGGFHLACDACNAAAVALLRERKHRPHKPFALMAADLDEARRIALVGPAEESLLLSPEHPIVLCPLSPQGRVLLAPGISPDTSSVGVMLPYTPLHTVLFEHFRVLRKKITPSQGPRPAVLVMTSGNPGGEPICLGNREALAHLGGMADAFLFHNRDILIRVDDSVVRPLPGGRGTLYFRRARGYAPRPVALDSEAGTVAGTRLPYILGAGAELKNTVCLTKGHDAFVSQHIGDMANVETASFHQEIREHLTQLLKVRPEAVVRDLHPDYLASRMAEDYGREHGVPVYRLQHHAAHAHAVLAEHQFAGRALVLALDGTGLGEDGLLWGGEALLIDNGMDGPEHRRLAHCAPLDLPGGEAAIREPWRIAHALLLRLGLLREHPLPWLPEYAAVGKMLPAMLERRINTPRSTSCGRLFDAVAALLGLCNVVSYEGQAAIRLEEAQQLHNETSLLAEEAEETPPGYCCSVSPASGGCFQLDTHSLFAAAWEDKIKGTPVPLIARRFHQGLASSLAELAFHLVSLSPACQGIQHVGLSGGCLQNVTLTLALIEQLEKKGLTPLIHKELPPGDGCISFGQAAWARLMLRRAKA